MNGYTTDYLYSSLPEEEDGNDGEDNDGDDDNENNVLKDGKVIRARKRQTKNHKSNSKYLKENYSESRQHIFEKNLSSSIVVPPVSEFSQVPHISPRKEKSSTNEQTRRKKGPVAFLPSSSSSNHLSSADRLVNIEDTINNLIAYVNILGEDVASIAVQLKPLLKNIKIIHNMYNDTNLMQVKHDLTSIRSFLREMTMTVYTRNEILSNKHLDEQDEHYATIIDALQNGFALNDGTINALYASLKGA
ncbi:unnamed protein product [Rotaria sordida]|uniref:Uncharacterized protein n=1 Tax=Rotaria sordida TaxID=392033 RepID=A0A819U3H3_9BILA|nr:unnamed protein product [Rotaria sordida]